MTKTLVTVVAIIILIGGAYLGYYIDACQNASIDAYCKDHPEDPGCMTCKELKAAGYTCGFCNLQSESE